MKRKLFLLLCALLTSVGMWAQTDVTATYITNPGFESCTASTSDITSAIDYASDGGWTLYYAGSNYAYSGVVAYGGAGQVNGASAPAQDNAGNGGNTLGFSVGWGNATIYRSAQITLPAGQYTLRVNAYNNLTGVTQFKSKFGFVTSDGSQAISTKNSFAVGEWVVDEVEFYLTAATNGYIQIGGHAVSGGTGGNGKVFFDNITLTKETLPFSAVSVDETSKVSTTSWTSSSGDYNTGSIQCKERFEETRNTTGNIMYQDISGLTSGLYNVELYAAASHAWNKSGDDCEDGELERAFVFADANSMRYQNTIPMADPRVTVTDGEVGPYTLSNVLVGDDGNLRIGLSKEAGGTNWHLIQIKSLTRVGVSRAAAIAAYNDALTEAQAFTEASMWPADWTALQTAISTNTLDLDDPDLTEEELNTATANLVAASAAATASVNSKTTYTTAVTTIDGGTNVDLTDLLTNPGFETGNTTGWTNSGAIGANAQGNKAFDNVQGNYYAERWHVNGTIDINQTVAALPAGIYRVDAYMYSDVADAQLYANSENVSVSTSKKYQVVVEIADKASLKIGASCTLTNSTWICMDAFTLTYLADSYANIPYTLATGKMGTDKAAAQTAAETAFLANPNKSTYEALLSAIAEAEASVGNYATLKTAIDKAQAVKDANNFVTAAAITALENEISTATTAWTNVTYTDAECNTEIATLGSTVSGWHAIGSEGMAGAYIASTWGKTSENWWTDFYINTWSTEGDNDGSGFSVPFFEYYRGDTDNLPENTFTATLTGLDNGMYEVEIWARAQRRTDANFNTDDYITMSVNSGDAVSIMNGDNIAGYDDNHTMRLGRFAARGEVTDGTLTLSIDVKLGSNVHWLSWRDVKYTKLDEANMAVNAAAEWGTFCAPFAVDIPSGVTAYTCASAPDGVLELTPQDSPIPANTPVILNAEGGLTSTMFYGKKEGNEDIVNHGMLYGNVSTEAKDVPSDGSAYLLQRNNNKTGFYQVTGTGYKIGYNRCYLVESGETTAREAFFFEDEGETAINEIEAVEAKAKGLKDGKYLINGRIVVVNNGRAFGANGQILK